MSDQNQNLTILTNELEQLQREQSELLEHHKSNAEGVFGPADIQKREDIAAKISAKQTQLAMEQQIHQSDIAANKQALEDKYSDFIKDKDFTPLQAARFRKEVAQETQDLGGPISAEILDGIMAEKEKELTKIGKETIAESQTVEGDTGENLTDQKQPEGDKVFAATVGAMASGGSNYIPPDDPESIEKFFTELNKQNTAYRQKVKADDAVQEEV